MQFRWSYFQRVLYDDGNSLTKLNETIRYPFIPYLFDNHVTENEADLSSLPVKEGALSIMNLNGIRIQNFETSKQSSYILVSTILVNKLQFNIEKHIQQLQKIKKISRGK